MTQASTLNILQRINAVMKELDYLQKEKKSGMQYSFVSHDKVTGAIRPLLVKHGIVCWPSQFDVKQEGNRTQLHCKVVFANIDEPEDAFEVDSFGYGIDAQDKGPGKAISYAVKYALLKTFALETGDDPDQDQNVKFEPPAMPAANGTPGASKSAMRGPYNEMVKAIRNAPSVNALKSWYQNNVTDIDALPPDFLDELRVEYNDRLSELKASVAA